MYSVGDGVGSFFDFFDGRLLSTRVVSLLAMVK